VQSGSEYQSFGMQLTDIGKRANKHCFSMRVGTFLLLVGMGQFVARRKAVKTGQYARNMCQITLVREVNSRDLEIFPRRQEILLVPISGPQQEC
jgi:hypothetical protein